MKPLVPFRQAIEDPELLGNVLAAESWATWRAVLLATMGETLTAAELELFRGVAGSRTEPPSRPIEEAAYVIGRRGGKDRAASVLAAFIAGLCDHTDAIVPGERGICLLIAPDQRQSQITLGYITACFERSPQLSTLIEERTADTLRLTNGIDIEVRAASFRRLRGVTAVAVIASEVAFWHVGDDAANADVDILTATRPTLATTGGPLILISSPYSRRGELWELYRRHFGAAGDPRILVVQGAARTFNPTLPQSVVDRALERDHAAASAEYLAQFRSDLEAFVSREVVAACVDDGVRERMPEERKRYFAFTDPSGGSSDSFTLAIGHKQTDGTVVLDCLREVRPPFSPEDTVSDLCSDLRRYRISKVHGDHYGGEWPREQFRKQTITYEVAKENKSQIYQNVLPLLNSGRVRLLDNPRLVGQLVSLERRTSRGGRDSIDHPPNGHDDLCNAAAGMVAIAKRGLYPSDLSWVRGPVEDSDSAAKEFQRARWQAHLYAGSYGRFWR
jgi:hypothetical protein